MTFWLFSREDEEEADSAGDAWGHVQPGKKRVKKRVSDSIYKLGWKLIWLALKIHR